jgi:hypothetical protein
MGAYFDMSKKTKADKAKIINKINNRYELLAYLFTYRPKTTAFVIFLIVAGLVAWLVFSGTTPEGVKEKVSDKVGVVETIDTEIHNE